MEGLLGHCRPGEACGNAACDGPSIREISGLRVLRTNATDLLLVWWADPAADSYRVRCTGDLLDLSTFRAGGGTAVPDADPTLIPEGPHRGSVGTAECLAFYQAEGLCLAPPVPCGACCEFDGSCTDAVEQAACEGRGGSYQGDGTECTAVTCPGPGACCMPAGCVDATAAACAAAGGAFMGEGTLCADDPCGRFGACCQGFHTEHCDDGVTESECLGPLEGSYAGNGTSCDTTDCSRLRGACCDLMGIPGFCEDVYQGFCVANSGRWMGSGTRCASTTC
jgi:hypothetical protein